MDNQISYTEEQVAPEVARKLLGMNTHNRRAKGGRVQMYRAEMAAGRWMLNGEAIKISSSGVLLDGQNRMLALAGLPDDTSIPMLVVRGLPDKSQDSMDGVAPRSLNDVLGLRGEKSLTTLGATIRAVYTWETYRGDPGRRRFGRGVKAGASTLALLEFFEERKDLFRDLTLAVDRLRVGTGIPSSVAAPLIHATWSIDREEADDFWRRVGAGLPSPRNFEERDALLLLRNQLQDMRSNKKSTVDDTYLAAILVKAWNAYRQGVPMGTLRWRQGGPNPESFPAMV